MTDSFAQAMVFFLVVLFGLGLTFPIVAYYNEKPKLKKLAICLWSCFPVAGVLPAALVCVCIPSSLKRRAALQNLLLKKVFAYGPKRKTSVFIVKPFTNWQKSLDNPCPIRYNMGRYEQNAYRI